MTQRLLHLGSHLSLPAEDFAEAKTAIIGQSGRGKSGALKVIEEQLFAAKIPFVVFDPAGVAWGIRSNFKGDGPGLPVLVIGGDHGDLPLDRHAGAEVARAVVQSNISCVIDFSNEPKAVYRQFLMDFCNTIFGINDSPRMLVIDEAPDVLPQKVFGDMAGPYSAVERVIRMGRNKGLGVVIVSQRAATINKDALTQCGNLFVFGLVGTPDRKALKEWVEVFGTPEQLKDFEKGLAELERRECWFWSPQEFGQFQKTRINDFTTFHPDRTHLRRMGMTGIRPVSTDVTDVVGRLGKVLTSLRQEKADLAEVPKLRLKVRQLETQLDARKTAPMPAPIKPVDDPKLKEENALLRQMHKSLSDFNSRLINSLDHLVKDLHDIETLRSEWQELVKAKLPLRQHGSWVTEQISPSARVTHFKPAELIVGPKSGLSSPAEPMLEDMVGPQLGKAAKRMLEVLSSRHPLKVTRSQLSLLSGYSIKSSGFANALSQLRVKGYLKEDPDKTLSITDEGRAEAGQVEAFPSTHEEIVSHWMHKLPRAPSTMLKVLVDAYPEAMSREELSIKTGYSLTSSGFANALSMLKTNRLADVDGTLVKASADLWATSGHEPS